MKHHLVKNAPRKTTFIHSFLGNNWQFFSLFWSLTPKTKRTFNLIERTKEEFFHTWTPPTQGQ